MRRPIRLLFALFTSLVILPSLPALAQQMTLQAPFGVNGQPPNSGNASKSKFEQFPSFGQLTSTDNMGTQTILRCGYTISNDQNAKVAVIDPEYHEISVLNPTQHTYSRLQHVGDYIIATFMPPDGQGLTLEMVKPDGGMVTKNCKTDLNNDAIANCSNAQPMVSAAEIRDDDQKITPQCGDLLLKSKTDFKPDLANPQLAAAYKASFSQKIQTLAAP